jgi:hypothetical protein
MADGTKDNKPATEPEESAHDRFARLATKRTSRALADIRSIGLLANKAQYEYSDAEAEAVVTALTSALRDTTDALRNRKVHSAEGFSLPTA